MTNRPGEPLQGQMPLKRNNSPDVLEFRNRWVNFSQTFTPPSLRSGSKTLSFPFPLCTASGFLFYFTLYFILFYFLIFLILFLFFPHSLPTLF